MTDDDALDLSAWQPPPPSPDFADAVIARARDTTTVGAVVALDHDRPRARPRWRLAALAAASAAVGIVATIAAYAIVDRAPEQRTVEIAMPTPAPAPLPAVDRVPRGAPSGATPSDIERVMRAHARAFASCGRGQRGKVVVAFDIDGNDGKVIEPEISSSTVRDLNVERCLLREVRNLTFPATGGFAHVEYPFTFYAPEPPPQPPAPPATCDAADLAARGRTALTNGAVAEAARLLDESLVCKDDPTLYQVTYLAVCHAGMGSMIKKYYMLSANAGKDTHAGENACLMNMLDPKTGRPLDGAQGTLDVACTPKAKVLLDERNTGKTTPAELQVTAGKHKVTFVVGADRFTYTVTIKPGETTKLSKNLE